MILFLTGVIQHMKSAIPSLTLDGWIDNKKLQMRKLWEYFMASEYSQSNTFYGNIASLKYLVATCTPLVDLSTRTEEALHNLYSSYFDSVNVTAYVYEKDDNKYMLQIAITCNDAGKDYNLHREILHSNGKIEKYEELLDNLYSMYST